MATTNSSLEIIAQATVPAVDLLPYYVELHYLHLEWYEVNVSSLKRKTNRGLWVSVQKSSLEVYKHEDIIFDQKGIRVKAFIKPCDSIVLTPRNVVETGKICFEIGNQHIPIFLNQAGEIMAAYDGHLYGILQGGDFIMRIEERTLHPDQMVKAYGNFF